MSKKRLWKDTNENNNENIFEKEDQTKKSKQFNAKPYDEFYSAVKKVKDCLRQYVDQPQSLPKTVTKFEHTASRLCTATVTIEADQIYYQLLTDGFISVDPSTKKLTFNKRDIITGTNDYDIAYEKAQMWILSCKNPPNRKDSLIKALRQICTFKKSIPFSLIISVLQETAFISVNEEKIDYLFLNNLKDHFD